MSNLLQTMIEDMDRSSTMEIEFSGAAIFTNSLYENNFALSMQQITANSRVGVTSLLPEQFRGTRFLHWKAGSGLVCFHEVWLDQDLEDNAVCFRLGGKFHFKIA